MADTEALTPPPPDEVAPEGAPSEYGGLSVDTLGPERAGERQTVYWIILVLLVAGSVLLRDNPYRSNVQVHTLAEAVATLLAFLIGGLALVRYYSRKKATFLLIGTGFLGAGLLDLNHALITTDFFSARSGSDPEALFFWSWTAGRTFLSSFLCASLLAWRREVRAEEGDGVPMPEGPVYVMALMLTLTNLVFFEVVPLTVVRLPWIPVARPTELIPAILFGLALVGFIKKGTWKRDAFEHWLLVALLISAVGHAAFMALSEQRYDAMFDAMHFLKIASHLAILTGLLFSVYATFQREGQALSALTAANTALEREVAVRAETEVAAEENRSRLQDFLDNANDLIQSVGPEGRILYVNSSWKRVLGYTDDQLDEMKVYAAVHPGHRKTFQSEVDRVLAGGDSRRFNVDFIARDGRLVILSGSLVAQYVRGRAVACQGIFRDVTEQRIAERQLADSQANLGALVENTGDSIWSVDREYRLITFNSAFALAAEAQSGNEPEVGQLPGEIFRPEDKEWYQLVYERAVSGNRHVAVRTDEVEGQLRYFELYANPIQGDEGINGAVLFGKDVTDRWRAEEGLRAAKEEAEAANKTKSDFLASMSHELRTPLNSVIGFTNILMKNRDGRLEDRELGFLQRVLANGKHLLELINEVLDLAKVEAGRMELVIDEVDLAQLVTETVGQLEGQAKVKEGNVRLVADVPEASNPVETDSSKLKQVIINLVGNALKFTHEGSVTVRLEMASDGQTPTAIAVQDTGIGIPEERLDAIFEAFQQAEAGTSRKYGGTGLGLALSRSICVLMGYDLIVSSEMGKGSTFSIVMGERAKRPTRPADDPPLVAPEDVETRLPGGYERHDPNTTGGRPALPGQRRMTDFKVLVVDDERDSRVLMAHYLEEFGCEVVTVNDGQAGLDAARSLSPDLITLDLMMPGMTGWEVLKRLKADDDLRGIPVVVVSIVAEEGRGRLLGAVDLVTKPFEREDILRVLWRNLARKRGGHVLVVDDDPDIRKLLTEMLSSVGLEVTQAADGQEALDSIRTGAPDMVLLDLMMPAMDGTTFLEKLRTDPLHRGLPVIVLSGKELSKGERNELARLASAVVHKGSEFEIKLFELLGSYFRLPDADE